MHIVLLTPTASHRHQLSTLLRTHSGRVGGIWPSLNTCQPRMSMRAHLNTLYTLYHVHTLYYVGRLFSILFASSNDIKYTSLLIPITRRTTYITTPVRCAAPDTATSSNYIINTIELLRGVCGKLKV